jgi:small subunit ribosomal protein S9
MSLVLKKKSVSTANVSRSYGTGRRKNAVARVWVGYGSGKFVVNNKDASEYFPRECLNVAVLLPFKATDSLGKFDVFCTASGGGHSGQAGAVQLGVARALVAMNPDLRPVLRQNGLLTRDPRAVERKKFGKHKARKSTQFSKR